MKSLMVESYLLLLWVEIVMLFRGLRTLLRSVDEAEMGLRESGCHTNREELCRAMDLACVFYPKRVLCLQRSAATVFLLRRRHIYAMMVIGAQMQPFKSHAWVEVDGVVVNDKQYMRDIYRVMERCLRLELSR